jgi:hypothetical protein
MATASNVKQKSVRRNKAGPKLRIAEWTVEQTTTPDHVNVYFTSLDDGSETGTSGSTTRRFLMHRDQADHLINELKGALAGAAAIECVEEETQTDRRKSVVRPATAAKRAQGNDAEASSDHLALGAYGLVGN